MFSILGSEILEGIQHRMLIISMLTSFYIFICTIFFFPNNIWALLSQKKWIGYFSRKLDTGKKSKRWQEVFIFFLLFLELCWGWAFLILDNSQKWNEHWLFYEEKEVEQTWRLCILLSKQWVRCSYVNKSGLMECTGVPSCLLDIFTLRLSFLSLCT